MDAKIVEDFKGRVQKELDGNIVPFWSQKAIDTKGGFIGRMNNDRKNAIPRRLDECPVIVQKLDAVMRITPAVIR